MSDSDNASKGGSGHQRLEAPDELRTLLKETRAIAIVGISEKPERDVHGITRYLLDAGYRIVGVHPRLEAVLGAPCYPSLGAIPEGVRAGIDLVAVFRNPEAALETLAEAASLGLRRVWLPPGAGSPAALDRARELGLVIVADMCLRTVHSRLLGTSAKGHSGNKPSRGGP